MNDIFNKFKIIDKLHASIKQEFITSINGIILQFYKDLKSNGQVDEIINQYASHTINATESVIDKDSNYPDYRLKEELFRTREIAFREISLKYDMCFKEEINEKVKSIMVKYFPNVFNLSGDGLRLLDANAELYNRAFIAGFYFIIKA